MGLPLNPNADPFVYRTPFVSPPKLIQQNPNIPCSLILVPPLHGRPHYPIYDIVQQVSFSWPCSDGFCGGGGGGCLTTISQPEGDERSKYCMIPKWVPRFHFDQQTTTLMIKNIPNQFRRNHLLNILDEHCKWKNSSYEKKMNNISDSRRMSEYNFVYLPMDFRKYWYDGKISNLGYAFVNFTNPTAASEFYKSFHRRQWDVKVNKKVCEITRAKLQGLKALMEAFRNKIFWCHANNYLPVMLEPSSNGYRRYRVTPVGKRIARPPPSTIKKHG